MPVTDRTQPFRHRRGQLPTSAATCGREASHPLSDPILHFSMVLAYPKIHTIRFKRLSINLPPLREHTEDIPLLVDHFLQMVSVELGQNIRGVSSRCMELLRHHDWPGNVRELENSIRSAAVLSRADVILPEHLPPEILNDSTRAQSSRSRFEMALESVLKETIRIAVEQEQEALYDEVIDAVDRVLIKLLLEEVQANQTKSAKLLGISRTTLLQKIKKLGLEVNP